MLKIACMLLLLLMSSLLARFSVVRFIMNFKQAVFVVTRELTFVSYLRDAFRVIY